MSPFTIIAIALSLIGAEAALLALTVALCYSAARAETRDREREDREVAELERAWELEVPVRVLINRFYFR
jgi:hypothetical protein